MEEEFDEELERLRSEKMAKIMDAHQERTDLAWDVITAIRGALRDGVKHYSVNGMLLMTELEIVNALLEDGKIYLEDPKE